MNVPLLIRGMFLSSRKSAKTDESFNTKRCTLWFDEYTGVDDPNVIGKRIDSIVHLFLF